MTFAEDIVERARGRGARLVLPEGHDSRIRDAAAQLVRHNLAAEILLVGDDGRPGEDGVVVLDPDTYPDRRKLAEKLAETSEDLHPSGAEERLADPLTFGAVLVKFGPADGMVAGASHATGEVIRAALEVIGTKPGTALASSSFVMDVPQRNDNRGGCFLFTDAGVVPDPDPPQLATIAASAVDLHRSLLSGTPRVAFLSFSTLGSADHPMAERVRDAVDRFRDRHPEVPADGELQGDAALVPEVARRKAPESDLEGDASILVFPDLHAGNIAYKLVERLAGAGAYGPLLQGIDAPVNDLSRGCSVEDVITVGAVTAVQARPASDA